MEERPKHPIELEFTQITFGVPRADAFRFFDLSSALIRSSFPRLRGAFSVGLQFSTGLELSENLLFSPDLNFSSWKLVLDIKFAPASAISARRSLAMKPEVCPTMSFIRSSEEVCSKQ